MRRPRFFTCDMMLSRPSQEHLTGNEPIMQDHLRAAVFTRFLLRGFVWRQCIRHVPTFSHIAICAVFVRAIFFCRLPHACCRPGDSPTITGCVLLHGVCATRCSRNLSAKHRPRIDPKYSVFVKERPLSTAHLFMISVNNQRQHVGGEEGKQKYGARGMSPRTRLCNQRAERH